MLRITKYEKTRLIGVRAEQISQGAPPCIPIGNLTEAMAIAEEEFKQKKCPLSVVRNFPDGRVVSVPVSEMLQ